MYREDSITERLQFINLFGRVFTLAKMNAIISGVFKNRLFLNHPSAVLLATITTTLHGSQ